MWRQHIKWIEAKGKRAEHLRVRCGCCSKSFDIYPDLVDDSLEICGVMGTKKQWQKLLLPLLGIGPDSILPSLYVIKAKRGNFSWIAAVVKEREKAQKLLKSWAKQKSVKFHIERLFNLEFPLVIIETDFGKKFEFAQVIRPEKKLRATQAGDSLIVYWVEQEFAFKKGEDQMGMLNHDHLTKKYFREEIERYIF